MTESVLFVPGLISARAAHTLPQTENLIKGLESAFQVEVAQLPGVGGPRTEPTWQALAAWLAEQMRVPRHIVCSGFASALVLVAATRAPASPLSLSMGGFLAPPATLLSLEMPELADAARVAFEMNAVPAGSFEMTRMVNPDREVAELERLSKIVNEDIDWPFYAKLMRSYQDLDLTVERPRLTCPVRFANFKVGMPGFDDMREVVVGLVPQVEVVEMDRWRGNEAAARIVDFIRRVSGGEGAGAASEAARRGRPIS